MIIYEIPLVAILFIILGALGIVGENASSITWIATIVNIIIELILLLFVIAKRNECEENDAKASWFSAYISAIIKAAVTTISTYSLLSSFTKTIDSGNGFASFFAIIGLIFSGGLFLMLL